MAIEDRDWYRKDPPKGARGGTRARPISSGWGAVAAVTVSAVLWYAEGHWHLWAHLARVVRSL